MPRIQTIHTPAEMKNLAINGALDFWQEKVGTTTTVNTGTTHSGYAADMFRVFSEGPTTKNFSYVRSSDTPASSESGFKATWSHLHTQITGIVSPAAADRITPFQYHMEGQDLVQIFGKVTTFGFWIKASVIGTYSFTIRNGASDRSYVTTFSVNQPNTWEFKSITVQMDTQGTWVFDNGFACSISIGTCTGSTFQTSTLNTWQSGNFLSASTSTNWIGTSGATVRVTLFSIVEGSLGFGAKGFNRCGETIQQELTMCQRYYEKSYAVDELPGTSGGTLGFTFSVAINVSDLYDYGKTKFLVQKRAAPSVSIWSYLGVAGTLSNLSAGTTQGNSGVRYQSTVGFSLFCNNSAMSTNSAVGGHWVADIRL